MAKIHGQLDGPERLIFSEKFACPVSGFTIPEIEPRLFSFNNPFGACPKCGGLGVEQHIDPELVISDRERTLRAGAIAPWAKSSSPYYIQTLQALGKHYKFTLDTKWKDLPKKTQDAILYGSGEDAVRFVYDDGSRSYETKKPFEGVVTNLERRWKETESDWAREEMAKYFTDVPCEACNGFRLKPEALCVKVGGKHIGEIAEMSVKGAGQWFTELPQWLTPKQNEIAVRVLKEIRERLKFLVDVGLEYLTLGRASGTLSGGESQRIRLASQIGSGLTGVLYVLDEPSIGLHQRDNARLLETLKRLRDLGNTVIVVEHDEDAIRTADHVLDIGPGAGIHGGQIIAQGTIERPDRGAELVDRQIPFRRTDGPGAGTPAADAPRAQGRQRPRQQPEKHQRRNPARPVHLRHRRLGLRQIHAGQHALPGPRPHAQRRERDPCPARPIEGIKHIDKVIDIDQSPIGRTPRSNPATYTGHSRRSATFRQPAGSQDARLRAGPFQLQRQGRAVRDLRGRRRPQIEMHFLPDVYVNCEACKGKRYNRETLEIPFKGKTIADVLDMTVEEGLDFFKAVPRVRNVLDLLHRSASATCTSASARPRSRAARRSASSSPRN